MLSARWVIALRLLRWGVAAIPDAGARGRLAFDMKRWLDHVAGDTPTDTETYSLAKGPTAPLPAVTHVVTLLLDIAEQHRKLAHTLLDPEAGAALLRLAAECERRATDM
jgi:hypothetical protein